MIHQTTSITETLNESDLIISTFRILDQINIVLAEQDLIRTYLVLNPELISEFEAYISPFSYGPYWTGNYDYYLKQRV